MKALRTQVCGADGAIHSGCDLRLVDSAGGGVNISSINSTSALGPGRRSRRSLQALPAAVYVLIVEVAHDVNDPAATSLDAALNNGSSLSAALERVPGVLGSHASSLSQVTK